MRASTIFRNRWWAMLWAAGILWFAYDVAGSAPAEATNNATATDATGAPVAADDARQIAAALNAL